MKSLYLMVACLLSSCAIEWQGLDDESAAWIEPKKSSDWLEYGLEIMAMSPDRLEEERAEKISQYNKGRWDSRLEWALVLGLQPKSEQDYTKALSILSSLQEEDDLDDESFIVLHWFEANLTKQKQLFDSAEKYKSQSDELIEKIEKLSAIEKNIRNRQKRATR